MSEICIYSQNVSSDKISEELIKIKGCENMTFEKRIDKIFEGLIKKLEKIDVIGFNEIRYSNRVEFIMKKLEKEGFEVKQFANNDHSEMSFRNILAIKKSSEWKIEYWERKWVAQKGECCFMSEKYTNIPGDQHGRCAGMVYLRHSRHKSRQVCVVISHVVPFGEVKKHQQNALFSINAVNMKRNIPTVLVGDLNRFPEDAKSFDDQLNLYGVSEAIPRCLIIPRNEQDDYITTEPANIGTFNPWPNDKVYEEKMHKPLNESRLDVHVYTKNEKMISVSKCYIRAAMFHDRIHDNSAPLKGYDPVRLLLDRKMASDHLPIISTYIVYG